MQARPIANEPRKGWLTFDRDAESSPRRLAILIGVAALLLLIILWSIGGDGEGETAGPAAPAPAPMPATSAPAPAPADAAAPAAATASASQIVLHGVMGGATNGSAIVSVGGAQRLVRVGREVAPGITLVAIGPRSITVDENGREVQVAFLDEVPNSPVASTTSSAPGGRAGPRSADAFRREAVAFQAGMQAAPGGDGFTLSRGRVPPAFAASGLRAGDRVIRVGGTELESPEDVERIPRELARGEAVEIEIVRDGRRQTVTAGAR